MRPIPSWLGPPGGTAVEAHGGLPGRQSLDLDVAPADAANAEAQHLGDRLLGSPAAGHRLGAAADVALLVGSQHALGEALAESLQGRPDPLDLDDVDAKLGRNRRADGSRELRLGPPGALSRHP